MKASEILKVKGNILYTVTPDTPIVEAVNTMAEKDIGSLVVMEYGELVGMLTFREVIKTIHANRGALGNSTVRKQMDDAPITVTPAEGLRSKKGLLIGGGIVVAAGIVLAVLKPWAPKAGGDGGLDVLGRGIDVTVQVELDRHRTTAERAD